MKGSNNRLTYNFTFKVFPFRLCRRCLNRGGILENKTRNEFSDIMKIANRCLSLCSL